MPIDDRLDYLCHELRNTVHGIYCSIDLQQQLLYQFPSLSKSKQPAALNQIIEQAKIINACAEQQKYLTDSILTFSKLEHHKLELSITNFELTEIIKNVINLFNEKIKQKNLLLILDIPDHSIWLKGDPCQLSQIFTNLISNAIKFTETGYIKFSINYLDNNYLQFTVEDTGIGMSQEEIGKLFQPFSQANPSTTAKYGGSGLGLSIIKQIIELMEGAVTVESELLQGTKFLLQIPNLSNKNILIVEDNIINQQLLANILKPTKCSCLQVNDAETALQQIILYKFDLVITDLHLPNKNSLELASSIRQSPTSVNQNTPIILLSGTANNAAITQALTEQIINDFLVKPYNQNLLFTTITKHFPPKIRSFSKHHSFTQIAESGSSTTFSHINVSSSGSYNPSRVTKVLSNFNSCICSMA